MKKRIRNKIAKRAANSGEPQRPIEALQHAVEELKDSALHLLETARTELQETASTLARELRDKAQTLLAYFKRGTAKPKHPAARRADIHAA